jgi:hypothetical protein
VRKFHALH